MSNDTILLVDDDPMSVEFMKIFLESLNFRVTTAYSYSEAARILTHGEFNFLITDIQLSDGSGVELAKVFREKIAEENASKVCVIGITGYSREDIQGLDSSDTLFNSILCKPVDFSILTDALNLRC